MCNLKGPSAVRIYPRLGIMTGCENPPRFSALDLLINKHMKNMVQIDCSVTSINMKKKSAQKKWHEKLSLPSIDNIDIVGMFKNANT